MQIKKNIIKKATRATKENAGKQVSRKRLESNGGIKLNAEKNNTQRIRQEARNGAIRRFKITRDGILEIEKEFLSSSEEIKNSGATTKESVKNNIFKFIAISGSVLAIALIFVFAATNSHVVAEVLWNGEQAIAGVFNQITDKSNAAAVTEEVYAVSEGTSSFYDENSSQVEIEMTKSSFAGLDLNEIGKIALGGFLKVGFETEKIAAGALEGFNNFVKGFAFVSESGFEGANKGWVRAGKGIYDIAGKGWTGAGKGISIVSKGLEGAGTGIKNIVLQTPGFAGKSANQVLAIGDKMEHSVRAAEITAARLAIAVSDSSAEFAKSTIRFSKITIQKTKKLPSFLRAKFASAAKIILSAGNSAIHGTKVAGGFAVETMSSIAGSSTRAALAAGDSMELFIKPKELALGNLVLDVGWTMEQWGRSAKNSLVSIYSSPKKAVNLAFSGALNLGDKIGLAVDKTLMKILTLGDVMGSGFDNGATKIVLSLKNFGANSYNLTKSFVDKIALGDKDSARAVQEIKSSDNAENIKSGVQGWFGGLKSRILALFGRGKKENAAVAEEAASEPVASRDTEETNKTTVKTATVIVKETAKPVTSAEIINIIEKAALALQNPLTLKKGAIINGNVKISNDLTIAGNLKGESGLKIIGPATIEEGNLTVGGVIIEKSGNLTIPGNLALTGILNAISAKFTGEVDFSGAKITGLSCGTTTVVNSYSSPVQYTINNQTVAATSIGATFGGVTYDFSAGRDLDVGEDARVQGTFYVKGSSDLGSGAFRGSLSVAGNLSAATTSDFSSSLSVDTAIASRKGVVVRGVTSQSANLLEAQNASGITLAWINPTGGFGASATSYLSSISPAANNTYDFGSYGAAWKNIYASGTFHAGGSTGNLSTLSSNSLRLNATASNASGTLFIDGSGNIYTSGSYSGFGSLLPGTNDTYDIGAFGTAWQDIYSSGTMYVSGTGHTLYSSSTSNNTLLTLQQGRGYASTTNYALKIAGPDATKYFSFVHDGTNMWMETSVGGGDIYIHPDGGQVYLNTDLIVGGGNASVQATGRANFSYDPAVDAPSLWLSTATAYPTYKTYFVVNPATSISFDRFIHFSQGTSDRLILGDDGDLLLNTSSTYSGNLLTLRKDDASRFYVDNAGNIYGSGTLYADLGASSPLYVADGSATSTLAKNYFRLNATASNASGTLYIGSDGNVYTSGTIYGSHNLSDLGSYTKAWKNIYGSGTAYLGSATTTQITPWANNTWDLGNYGAAWKDVYASGTLLVGGSANNLTTLSNNFLRMNATAANASGTLYVSDDGNLYTSGTIYASVGAAATPSYTFGADANTGMYQAGGDALAFGAGGIRNFYISASYFYPEKSFVPAPNNGLDMGVYGGAWRNIYASGTAYLGSATTTQITPWANNTWDLGNYGAAWKDVYASGTLLVGGSANNLTTISNNFLRMNATESNASGTLYLDNSGSIYSSGTLFVPLGSATAPTITIGDSDTGFYSQGAGSINITNNGSNYYIMQGGYFYSQPIYSFGASAMSVFGRSPDVATSVGIILDNSTSFTTTGAKLLSIRNSSVEKAFFDYNGELTIADKAGTVASSTLGRNFLRVGETAGYTSGTLYIGSNGNLYTSGTIYASAGAAATPSLTFAGDSDTGIYNTPGLISFSINGAEYFRIGVGATYHYGALAPGSAGGYSIGAYSVPWNSIYASGTAYMGSTSIWDSAGNASGTLYQTKATSTFYSALTEDDSNFTAYVFDSAMNGAGYLVDWRDRATSRMSLSASGTLQLYNQDVKGASSTQMIVRAGGGQTTDKMLDIRDNSNSSLFSVNPTLATFGQPVEIAVAGDVGFAYDLEFTNPDSAYIRSQGPLYIEGGDINQNLDLTLRARNYGEVVVADSAMRIVRATSTNSGTFRGLTIDMDDIGTMSGTMIGLDVDFTGVASGTVYAGLFQGGIVGIGTSAPGGNLGITSVSSTLPIVKITSPSDNLGGSSMVQPGFDFSATGTFRATSTDYSGNSAFIFDTNGDGNNAALLTIRSNGVNKFIFNDNATSTLTGNVYINGELQISGNCTENGGACADLAEIYNSADAVEPGDVVVVSGNGLPGEPTVEKSKSAYAENIAGVVSESPGITFGANGRVTIASNTGDATRPAVALAGRVPVKISLENGPISAGDLLVSASEEGRAMKYDLSGASLPTSIGIIGVALESYNEEDEDGKILVMLRSGFVSPQQLAVNTEQLSVETDEDGNLVQGADGYFNNLVVASIKGASGNWEISEDGKFVAKEIKTQKIQTEEFGISITEEKRTVGTSTIPEGETKYTLENNAVNKTSRVFITFRGNPGGAWWISRQDQGWFEISLSSPAITDVEFDYWIISVMNETAADSAGDGPPAGAPSPESDEPPADEPPAEEPAPVEEPAPEPEASADDTTGNGSPEGELLPESNTAPTEEPPADLPAEALAEEPEPEPSPEVPSEPTP